MSNTNIPFTYLKLRRIVEVFLIIIASPVLIILTILTAFSIFLEDGSPVFFIQKRPGKNGKMFCLIKFRSMTKKPQTQFELTQKQDNRITTVGRIIRKFHLDEIPQLWNVLKGDMSLIGPRPVPAELYNCYLSEIPNYDFRHVIRPGVTGLAQIELGYTNTLEGEQQKWNWDRDYILNISPKADFRILWRTFVK